MILLFACVIIFTKCAKEYSFEGGALPDTAAFTLVGAGGTCSGSTILGTYKTGVPLTTGNTVQLQVDVTKAGLYNVSTVAEDGIQFSATGTFADTGRQGITLSGTGTPVSPGNFTFITPVGPGCSFLIDVRPATADIASFTLAGAPAACDNAIVNGTYFNGEPLTADNNVVLVVNVSATGAYTVGTDTINGISFSTSGTFTATGNQAITLIGTGTPEYARNVSFTPLAGISGCTFKVPVLAAGPPATYVLVSNGGLITPCVATVAGTYTSNVALSGSNTISEEVYVTVAGNFAISTNMVNGIFFYQTGTFTTTGNQQVILKGVGTPVNTGKYVVVPEIVGPAPLGGESCGVEVEVK